VDGKSDERGITVGRLMCRVCEGKGSKSKYY
jgi:hypothetical protein